MWPGPQRAMCSAACTSLCLASLALLLGAQVAAGLEVDVEVAAAWPAAPLAAELLEGLAEVGLGPSYLRALVKEAAALPAGSSDSVLEGNGSTAAPWLQAAARAAEAQLCCDGRSSFGRFLSLRARHALASARVEAARSLERADRGAVLATGCPPQGSWAAVTIGTELAQAACTAASLSGLVENLSRKGGAAAGATARSWALSASPLDHVLYEKEAAEGEELVKAVGYASLGSPQDASPVLAALFGLADKLREEGRPGRVVFRHGVASGPTSEASSAGAPLAGFGVELLTRSADEVTKSADNEVGAVAAGAAEGACVLSNASSVDPVQHFNGVDLAVLVKHHPDAAQALCELENDLRAEVEKPTPPWVLKRLGAHAALRAVKAAAGPGGPLAGLAALEEAAQDYPAGWAQALAAGSFGEEAAAREVLDVASIMTDSGQLEVNGWRVPEHRRGTLSLLQTFAPLFRAAEALAVAGLDESKVFDILRDTQARQGMPSKIDFGDPRLGSGDNSAVALLYDTRSDPKTERIRQKDAQEQSSALLRLAQYYGRYWRYPPPLPRALVGVGLVIDPCVPEQMNLVKELLAGTPPLVVWIHLSSESHPKVAAYLQANMPTMTGKFPWGGSDFLERFVYEGGGDACKQGAKKRIKKVWSALWSKAGEAEPELKEPEEDNSGVGLPVPSATVNGQLLTGSALLATDALPRLCQQEVEKIVIGIQRGRQPDTEDSDAAIAKWQYSSGGGYTSTWHPALVQAGAATYVPLKPDLLRSIPGGKVEGHVGGTVVAHILILGEPHSDVNGTKSPLADFAQLFRAFAKKFEMSQKKLASWETEGFTERVFKVTVAGGCPEAASATDSAPALTPAAALRRCLAVAFPPGMSVSAALLGSVAGAWSKVTNTVDFVRSILEPCSKHAQELLDRPPAHMDSEDFALCRAQQDVVQALGPVPANSAVLAVNGRRFGPIHAMQSGMLFAAEHVDLAEDLEMKFMHGLSGPSAQKYSNSGGTTQALRDAGASADPLLLSYALALRARAIEQAVASRSGAADGEDEEEEAETSTRRTGGHTPAQTAFEEAPANLRLHLAPDASRPCPLRVFAVVNPLGKDAQRLPSVLRLLHEELNAEVGIALRPQPLVSPPLLSYYRPARVAPAPAGALSALGSWNGHIPGIQFSIPPRQGQLLSMQLHTPAAWMVSAVDSGDADLDSVSAKGSKSVRARYMLESLFVEGWAMTADRRPANSRHLAFVPLGAAAISASSESASGRDSVVVKSGYFQLRAPPGLYSLSLLRGEDGERLLRPRSAVGLVDLAGRSTPLDVQVGASDGSKAISEEVIEMPAVEEQQGNYDGAGGDSSKCPETIHIFSVASGHRYERLLRIMILSVREHTECPIRLWLVDNFLSPSFRKLLPSIAERVGFAVSRVTYKWPAWLREQTQKQRVIWAYKILFLDVFFPKQVERVLFIDADQIVRANVRELWTIDLHKAVYGFVPFCSTTSASSMFGSWGGKAEDLRNPDTLGFRFWEQGFWKRHLESQSKVYHISALFVVDLVAFRARAAGDTLRDVYQQLTEDPNSLANLDQDLPNYVQHQLPIFSLPQEWLWCESWCSEESKARAKTIDMCQNPIKKEGKLQSARRIAPEWNTYDQRLEAWINEAGFNITG
mmetsp:Transcript_118689/g.378410  ORF Transcript_118689/g.378410 Transcript_118689/m.378410 type:complete len:1644 (-) Transcript_118689:86-5017(-)